MFNYHEIDKYITIEHLTLIVNFIAEKGKPSPHYMISSLERNGNEYTIHFSDAGTGFSQIFKIEDGKVLAGETIGFWMS